MAAKAECNEIYVLIFRRIGGKENHRLGKFFQAGDFRIKG
jgi:hypothetical protein